MKNEKCCLAICMYLRRLSILLVPNKPIYSASLFFNSRCQLLNGYYLGPLFFCNSKNLNCIGALSFLRLEEEYWRSPFLSQFYWSYFWRGKWNAWKNWSDFGAEERSEKRVVFVHTAIFERARNWCVKRFSLSERIFFVHERLFKAVFLQLLMVEVLLW